MSNSRLYEEEKERILAAIRAITEHFPDYLNDCDLNWPRCYIHKTEMCQVLKKGENTYYQCFEFDYKGTMCGHKEWGI